MDTVKNKPPRSGGGSKEVPDKSKNTTSLLVEASADERRADLLEEAASLLAKSICSTGSGFRSPAVRTVEEALRVLFMDAAAYHRYLSASPRNVPELLFKRSKAAA